MILDTKWSVVAFVASWGVACAQPLFTPPVQILTGTDSDAIGHACTGIGDIDGDGYGDLAVGHRTLLCAGIRPGAVFIVRGSSIGVPAGQAAACAGPGNYDVLSISADGAWFGWAITPLGDVDGDGYDDIAVGAPYFTGTFFEQGAVFVYRGSASGLMATPAAVVTGEAAEDHFGWSISGASDINGDGVMDLVVGAPGFNAGAGLGDAGAAYRFFGSTQVFSTSTASASSRFWAGAAAGLGAGASLSVIGDQNGDGFEDVLVGTGASGPVLLFNGTASGPPSTPAWTSGATTFIDMRVGAAGDVNGDGYADLLVGDLAYPGPPNSQGRTLLWHGGLGGPGATFDWSHDGSQCCSSSGCSVFTAGDADGDGYADILIGERGADLGTGDSHGQVLVFRGSANGLPPPPNTTAAFQPTASTPGAHTGDCVRSAGDLNGDGRSDIVFSATGPGTNGGWVYVAYGVASLPSPALPAPLATGGQPGARLGQGVTIAGDINGDGRDDAVWSAYSLDLNPGDNRGAIYFALGADQGLGPPSAPIYGPVPNSNFGLTLARAGDVNGDGLADVIVGMPNYSIPGIGTTGGAQVFLGAPAGLSTSPAWTFLGTVGADDVGSSVAGAGDVNGDGFDDLLAGGWGYNNNEGRVRFFYGSAGGPSPVPDRIFGPGSGNTGFGTAVSGVGDVNRDGYDDVAIGAGLQAGSAYLWLGSPAGLGATPVWTLSGGSCCGHFGIRIARIGDAQGTGGTAPDGAADFLVARDNGPERVTLFLGDPALTPPTTNPIAEITPPWLSYGVEPSTAGDQDGDGQADILLGVPQIGTYQGTVGVFNGTTQVFGTVSPLWSLPLTGNNTELGAGVSGAGDVNGDGVADLLYGSPAEFGGEGAVRLTIGQGQPGVSRCLRQAVGEQTTCRPIPPRGRSPYPDRFTVSMHGRSPLGRNDVRLEVESKPVGTPYTGLGLLTTALADTGAPVTGQGSMVALTRTITGLQASTCYAWRARLRSRSPYWPRSPWFALSGGSWTDVKVRTAPAFQPTLSLDWPDLITDGGVSIRNGPSGSSYFTVITGDFGNFLSPATGWWGGLHVSFSEVLNLYLSGAPPFLGTLDACGNYLLPIPAPMPPLGFNITVYGVSLLWGPDFTGFTNLDSAFIP